MTRMYTRRPVWAWYCDRCERPAGHLAWDAHALPSPDDMRAKGWFIAKTFGDLCPSCVAEREPSDTGSE